jgi:hypothetical protein
MNRTDPPRLVALAAAIVLALVLGACGGPRPPVTDPYADPGTPPPPTITNPTIATSGSVAPRPDSADLMNVNVAGFAAPGAEAGAELPNLTADDFTVVEDGVVKGITVERIGGGVRAAADIAFVFDTTGSMGSALDSVQASIIEFVDFLGGRGLDVRVGAVTFGDAFDTKAPGSTRTGESLSDWTPPPFDPSERPTFPLSTDFAAFRTFIEEDSPRGGGDIPENALGALEFAYENLVWRAGAQRILIVIVDTCSHNDVTFPFTAGDDWLPPNPDDLLARLRGNATVHAVSPANVLETDFSCSSDPVTGHTDMAMFTGAGGTGGVHVPVSFGAFDFDLTELPIAEATAGGYLVTYRGTRDGSEHTVRVVIDDDVDIRGEFTVNATY